MFLSATSFRDKALVRNGKLLMIPGQQISLEAVWNLKSDDALYLPTEMNFAFLRRRVCDNNIACVGMARSALHRADASASNSNVIAS